MSTVIGYIESTDVVFFLFHRLFHVLGVNTEDINSSNHEHTGEVNAAHCPVLM